MAHLRSKASWRSILAGKTSSAMAETIIADLTGYRSTSLYRSDDTDGLSKAIEAIVELTIAQADKT